MARNQPNQPAAQAQTSLSVDDLLKFIGFDNDDARGVVTTELLPNGPSDFVGKDIKRLTHSCASFKDRATNPFHVTDHQLTNLVYLVYWATRNSKVGLSANFRGGITKARVLTALRKAGLWHNGLKDRITRGNSWLTKIMDTKLDTQLQWKTWLLDLERILSMIIGEKGIPISYVIRIAEQPSDKGAQLPFTERAYHLASVNENDEDFHVDAQVVHNVILDNLVDKGAAAGYVAKLKKHMNGRKDIMALRGRFDSAGATNTLVQDAQNSLDTLVYKSERALPFETFRSQLIQHYEALQDGNCVRNDNEKIKDLWPKIQAPFLAGVRDNLMGMHTINNLTFEEVLDHFAILIPQLKNGAAGLTARVNQVSTNGGSERIVHDGTAPSSGAHLPDGSLFTGNYTKDQWNSDAVKAHHPAIKAARAAHRVANGGRARQHGKKRQNSFKQVKRENKKLKASIASLETRFSKFDQSQEGGGGGKEVTINNSAGDAFGGRHEMVGGKKKKKE